MSRNQRAIIALIALALLMLVFLTVGVDQGAVIEAQR